MSASEQLPEHRWVRDTQTLAELAKALADAPWVALDSESNSMFAYRERVCLIQLNVHGALWIIDPLALAPGELAGTSNTPARDALGPLRAPLADPKRAVWVHGGSYDVACLKRDFDLELAGLFDTQQAASFLGWRRTGYAAVVEEVCGISLGKQHAQYDWGRRPLDRDALRYALDDVVHLPELARDLASRIAAADLEEELALANATVAQAQAHDNRFDPQRMWRLKGIGELGRRHLPMLTALYAWRDRKGRELDLPPGRVVANQPLLQLARRAPRDRQGLRRARVRSTFISSHGDELLATIAAAITDPPAVPERPARPRPPPARDQRDSRLRAWRRAEAERRELPAHVVLPPRALEWISAHGVEALEHCPELGAKRIARYGAVLAELLTEDAAEDAASD